MTRGELAGWSIPVSVGIVSLVLALSLPREQIDWSGWVYVSLAILGPLYSMYHKRKMAGRLRDES